MDKGRSSRQGGKVSSEPANATTWHMARVEGLQQTKRDRLQNYIRSIECFLLAEQLSFVGDFPCVPCPYLEVHTQSFVLGKKCRTRYRVGTVAGRLRGRGGAFFEPLSPAISRALSIRNLQVSGTVKDFVKLEKRFSIAGLRRSQSSITWKRRSVVCELSFSPYYASKLPLLVKRFLQFPRYLFCDKFVSKLL